MYMNGISSYLGMCISEKHERPKWYSEDVDDDDDDDAYTILERHR